MILVTGPTGNIGRLLVEELLCRGAQVRVLLHTPMHAETLEGRGAEVHVGSFEDDNALAQASVGVERVFLLSPPGTERMVYQQTAVLEAARRADVRHVVKLSSIAAEEPRAPAIIAAHREIERRIEASGLEWTHLRPNWFMQNELAQVDEIADMGTFHAPNVTDVAMVDGRDVAEVAAVALTGADHERQVYVLTGPEPLAYAQLEDIYATHLGRPVRWVEVTLEETRQAMLDAGLSSELASGFTEIMDRYRQGGVTRQPTHTIEALTGRAARSFGQFLRDHVSMFGPHPVAAREEDDRDMLIGGKSA